MKLFSTRKDHHGVIKTNYRMLGELSNVKTRTRIPSHQRPTSCSLKKARPLSILTLILFIEMKKELMFNDEQIIESLRSRNLTNYPHQNLMYQDFNIKFLRCRRRKPDLSNIHKQFLVI